MSEHMKCSASPIVVSVFTSTHSRLPAVPLRLARRIRLPTGDHHSVEQAFFSNVLRMLTLPLYLEPIV